MSLRGQIHIWVGIYLWLWGSVAIAWVGTQTPEAQNMAHFDKFRHNFWNTLSVKSASCLLVQQLNLVCKEYFCPAHICKCAEGAVLESEWPVEQLNRDRAKLNRERAKEKLWRKTMFSWSRPCVKKPLKTGVKHSKCCNHYLDKDRTHLVLVNKSVVKTESKM